MPAGPVHITLHAALRAQERLGLPNLWQANRRLEEAFGVSLRLPTRHARALLRNRPWCHPRHRVQVRVAGDLVLICKGRRVLTTWRLELEQLATVIVWVATGIWPLEGE